MAIETTGMLKIYLRIDPGRFHFLKFLLEGYDNFAVISSIKKHGSVIKIRIAPESYRDLITLLSDVSHMIKKSSF